VRFSDGATGKEVEKKMMSRVVVEISSVVSREE